MTYCCVPFCTSNRKKSGGRLSFHEFPCDRERCEKWLKVISRQDFVPNSNSPSSVVCSLHFKEEDYCNNGKFRRLKPNVVPTIFPNYSKYKVTGIKRPRRTITKTDLPPAKKRKSSSDVGFSVFKQDVPSSSAPVNDVFFLPVKSDHKDTQTDSVQRSEVSKSAVIRVAMDEIKMEPEIDPLSIETSDNTDLEEKKPFLEEGKSFDLHLNRIKEECLDQSSDFNSEINFEDIAMPNNVSVVKCETEEGNLQDMGLNAEAIDHSCLTSEIKVEEVAVPYFFEVKCEPQEKSHDLDTVKDDLTLDVMPLEDTVITDRMVYMKQKTFKSDRCFNPLKRRHKRRDPKKLRKVALWILKKFGIPEQYKNKVRICSTCTIKLRRNRVVANTAVAPTCSVTGVSGDNNINNNSDNDSVVETILQDLN
ncbi:THAP domain-containing protein 5-like isoform X4 [Periplaneta americana]|uniref:THAP domain-containing protein 5-like isoform X4 n=1 Tax=Periplaneta americana TaxID=6978 RepID=UPI0037E8EB56